MKMEEGGSSSSPDKLKFAVSLMGLLKKTDTEIVKRQPLLLLTS